MFTLLLLLSLLLLRVRDGKLCPFSPDASNRILLRNAPPLFTQTPILVRVSCPSRASIRSGEQKHEFTNNYVRSFAERERE